MLVLFAFSIEPSPAVKKLCGFLDFFGFLLFDLQKMLQAGQGQTRRSGAESRFPSAHPHQARRMQTQFQKFLGSCPSDSQLLPNVRENLLFRNE